MSLAKRFSLFVLILILAGIILILLSPLLVSNGLRLFAWWKGRVQGVKIEFRQIDAPFLKPVVIRGLRITSTRPCIVRIDLTAERATFALNLRTIFFLSNARFLHAAWIDGLRCEIRRDPRETAECNFDWRFLHRLLADQVKITNVDLRVNNGSTDFHLRGAEWTASEIESGQFLAREINISTPLFQQTFTDLRGATKWENDHLTLGALSLARGLDVETITADFSQLERKRVGIELNLDAFGGKMRASIASENRDKGIVWNGAGDASAISLAQMSTALGLREPAGGTVRACKFTFHGDVQNLAHATASVWTEMSGFIWRDRLAETVMFGASLYNRQIEIEQFYVKQRNNQFTLSGQYTLPAKSSDWINPNFRADISTSISDLGEFAKLFGGSTKNFSGALNIFGTVNGRVQNLGGQITVEGNLLRLWGAPLDTLSAKLNLKGPLLSLESLKARHLDDFFNATGEVNLTRNHRYVLKINAAIANLAAYAALLPEYLRDLRPEGRASIGWDAHGTAEAHSGDFRIQAENVGLTSNLRWQPFNVKMEGIYSPEKTFFREFRLSNAHAELNAFVNLSSDYLQLQTIRFDLNGKPKLQGHVFIPITLQRWWPSYSMAKVNASGKFDINVLLDEIDLAELQGALSDQKSMAGKLGGRLETYGSLHELQAKSEVQLRDFSLADPNRVSADLRAEISSGSLKLVSVANTTSSDPVKLEATLPLDLTRVSVNGQSIFAWDRPISATISFPAVLLSKLPHYLTPQVFQDGILSGNLVAAGTLQAPSLSGDLAVLNGKFVKTPGPIGGFGGRIMFQGKSAAISFANLDLTEAKLPFDGSIDFSNTSNISIKLFPEARLYVFDLPATGQCVSGANIFGGRRIDGDATMFAHLEEVDFHGGFGSTPWTITLVQYGRAQTNILKSRFSQTFSLCQAGGEILQLAIPTSPKVEWGERASNIFQGRNPASARSGPVSLE
jgi:hypothetical protein